MKKLIYFSHIPKAAGSTFSSILRRNYRSQYLSITHGFFEGFISRRCLDLQLQNNSYKAIGGHRISFDVPYDSSYFDVRCIAFIRDPAQRLFSEFCYVRKLGIKGLASQCHTFLEFLDKIAESGRYPWYNNTQSRYQTLEPAHFHRLVESDQLLLFPVDRFDDSLFVLRSLFGDLNNISYVATNVNGRATLELPEKQGLLSIPHHLIDRDAELYSIASNNLDRLLNVFRASPTERLRFKLGCKLRRPFDLASSALLAASNRINSFGF